MAIERFEDLVAWQEARRLSKAVYLLCRTVPLHKDFGMADQLRRAAVSVMANIAEGFGCATHVEFARFLVIARRSALEVQSLLYCCLDANYIDDKTFATYRDHAVRTNYLIDRLRNSLHANSK